MCCGGLALPDPPTGTIRQGFNSNYPHLPQGRNQCCDVVRGQFGTSAQILRSIVPPPPPCAAVGLALQTTLWYHKTRNFHIQTTHTYPRDASSVADVVPGPPAPCSSNSTVPIVPPPPPCAAVGLGSFRSTLWYHRQQKFHIQATHTYPRTQPVLQTWFGATRHMQLKFYRSIVPHHHHVLRCGITRSTPLHHKTRLHIQTTHTYPRDATSVAEVVWGQRHMQLKFYRSIVPATTTMCCGGLGLRSTPLVP
jgi:hypothetical protein